MTTTANTIEFKTTIARNIRGELGAETVHMLPDLPGRGLHIRTSKTTGGVVTSCTAQKKDGAFWCWELFGDYSKRTMHKGARATEKTIAALHAQALQTVPDMLPAIVAHYATKTQ